MLSAKISGIAAAVGAPDSWTVDTLRPFVDDALDLFGPSRLMFASDWPMLLRFATYEAWVEAVDAFIDRRGLSATDRNALLAHNARRANPRMHIPSHHLH